MAVLAWPGPVPELDLDAAGRLALDHGAAQAGPFDRLKRVQELVDSAVNSSRKVTLLEKVAAVVTGGQLVTPEVIDKQIKGILDFDTKQEEESKPLLDLDWDILSNIGDAWESTVEAVSKFNPVESGEAAEASVVGFFEGLAERFTAFELSTAVGLGERWLIFGPLVALPMIWSMKNASEGKVRKRRAATAADAAAALSALSTEKGAHVRAALQRLELKRSLFQALDSLSQQEAFRPVGAAPHAGRQKVEYIMEKLQQLAPAPAGAHVGALPGSEVAAVLNSERTEVVEGTFVPLQPAPQLYGDWRLRFVSGDGLPQQQELPSLLGVEISHLRQEVQHRKQDTVSDAIADDLSMLACNSAQIRLGPLGVFEVAVQGSWEKGGSLSGLVQFDTFSARPLQLLGQPVSNDLPKVTLSLPKALQRSADWETIYLDDDIRINRSSRSNAHFVFQREPAA
eukprot:SM000064S19719  [mRNA]  locus=s64:127093:129762:+ [translate_table: standard]